MMHADTQGEAMAPSKTPPVINPTVDVGEELKHLMGETGALMESLGSLKIKVFHTRAFPWDEVFKTLLYRDFQVYVTRHKADLYIEAKP
jgi:hypothetical protein